MNKLNQINIKIRLVYTLFLLGVVLAKAQNTTVSGVVKDEDEDPMEIVSVVVKNTSRGVVTDAEGLYEISAKPGDILVFSFLGFKTVEVQVGKSKTIDAFLEKDNQNLGDMAMA